MSKLFPNKPHPADRAHTPSRPSASRAAGGSAIATRSQAPVRHKPQLSFEAHETPCDGKPPLRTPWGLDRLPRGDTSSGQNHRTECTRNRDNNQAINVRMRRAHRARGTLPPPQFRECMNPQRQMLTWCPVTVTPPKAQEKLIGQAKARRLSNSTKLRDQAVASLSAPTKAAKNMQHYRLPVHAACLANPETRRASHAANQVAETVKL